MKVWVETDCPYCDFHNTIRVEPTRQWHNKLTVNCDLEYGGCDKQYFIEFHISVEIGSMWKMVEVEQSNN
jgi:hypothetical protein